MWDQGRHVWPCLIRVIQWNLSVTTTSIIKFITCDLFNNVFNEDWRYQFTLANNVCSWPPRWAPEGRKISLWVVVIDRFHCIWDNDNHVMKVYSNNSHLCLNDGDISGGYHMSNCLFKTSAFWKHVHGTFSGGILPWYIRNGSENYSVPNGQQVIIETRDDSVWWGMGFTGLRWVGINYC